MEYCNVTETNYFRTEGDGACLFRSIAMGLFKTQDQHLTLRRQAVDSIVSHWSDYGTFVFFDVENRLFESQHEYSDYMTKPGTYGTATEMIELSKIHDVTILYVCIRVNSEGKEYAVCPKPLYFSKSGKSIALRVTNEHTAACHIEIYKMVPNMFRHRLVEHDSEALQDLDVNIAQNSPGFPIPLGVSVKFCRAAKAEYYRVPDDGNSLFASISLGYYRSIYTHAKLRDIAVKGISRNFSIFDGQCFDFVNSCPFKSSKQYRSRMGQDLCPGGYAEANVVANTLDITIVIVSITMVDGKQKMELSKLFNGGHGNVVVLRMTNSASNIPHFDTYRCAPEALRAQISELFDHITSPPKKTRHDETTPLDHVSSPVPTVRLADDLMLTCDVTNALYKQMVGDGAGLFRAISFALHKTDQRHKKLRERTVQHICANWADFHVDAFNWDLCCEFRNVEQYAKYMKNKTSRASTAEIRALAVLCDLAIVVISVGDDSEKVEKKANLRAIFGDLSRPIVGLRETQTGTRPHYDLFLDIPDDFVNDVAVVVSQVPQTPSPPHSSPVFATPLPTPRRRTPRSTGPPPNCGSARFTPSKSKNVPTVRPKAILFESDDEQIDDDAHPDVCTVIVPKRVGDVSGDNELGEFYCDENRNLASIETTYNPHESSKSCDSDDEIDVCGVSEDEEVVEVIMRPRPWVALPLMSMKRPTWTLKPHIIDPSYMSAALYGDENWSLLRPLCLPPINYACPFCHARYRPTELTSGTGRIGLCCNFGKISFGEDALFRDPSQVLKDLYTMKHLKSTHFKSNILAYNRAFSTVQFIAKGLKSSRRGPFSVLTVNGKITYEANAYGNPSVIQPGQVYFCEQDHDAVQFRMATSTEGIRLDEELVALFQSYLEQNNKFVQCFKTARELIKEENEAARRENRAPRELTLAINPRPKERSGYRVAMEDVVNYMLDNEFARPCRDFVAAVFMGDLSKFNYDTYYVNRDRLETDSFPRLVGSEATIDIQTYPLIHLHGEKSWSEPDRNYRTCTLRQYYAYRVQDRGEEYSPLLWGGKLFSQWLLDAAIKIEYHKLQYLSANQQILKASQYKTLKAYIESQARAQGKTVGRFCILPKTFTKSPRWRQERFLNGLAVARHFGTPSWFITMTTNPRWPEIQDAMPNGVTWMERPDIVVRVFLDRKRHLLSDLIEKKLFGRVLAYFTTDEFQKSSLPHCHILLIMHPDDRPMTGEDVDRFVQAEFPPVTNPAYKVVLEHMMHHACDRWNSDKIPGCFADGRRCRFRYPQKFSNVTDVDCSRVQYRRRDDGRTVKCPRTSVMVDNRNVVPHNRYLLVRHQCHINVEYKKATLQSFKYLCVYVNKNPDMTYVSLTDKNRATSGSHYEWDEIEHYRQMRYMSPAEAVYTIMGHKLGECSHSVIVLPIHLPDEHTVVFQEGEEDEALHGSGPTMLTAWFELNRQSERFRENFYCDVPSTHKWNGKDKCWRLAVKNANIGRLALITPSARTMELFYLRVLLLNVPGATSFDDLLTYNGIKASTFNDACLARGLLEDDNEAYMIIAELSTLVNASYLRYQFCLVLNHCQPQDARRIWDDFKERMADDYSYRSGKAEPEEVHINMALSRIWAILRDEFKLDGAQFGLPLVNSDLLHLYTPLEVGPTESVQETFTEREADEVATLLNPHQRSLYDMILDELHDRSTHARKIFLVVGAGGSGKTFLYNSILKYCLAHQMPVAACAFTGIAAILLHNGVTAHRLFGIPINPDRNVKPMSTLETQTAEAEFLRTVKLIIWDEISMVASWQVEVVDTFLRLLMKVDKPFGGKIVIFGGDFRQTLPVVKRGTRKTILEECFINNVLWPDLRVYQLSVNMRAIGDVEFAEWLLRVGNGSANNPGTSRLDIPGSFYVPSLAEMVHRVFGPCGTTYPENAVILTPKNRYMRDVNSYIFEKLEGQTRTYLSANTFEVDNKRVEGDESRTFYVTQEMLQDVEGANLPPHRLMLKEGCIVMLLCNLHVAGGMCNGTRLRVLRLFEKAIECKILNGPKLGSITYIFRVKLARNDTDLPGTLSRTQFPIRLAYCVTINKSQGSTYDKIGIFLPEPCFSHGQLYVAFSRARSASNVFIHVRKGSEQGITTARKKSKERLLFTRNEVYREVVEAIISHPNLM